MNWVMKGVKELLAALEYNKNKIRDLLPVAKKWVQDLDKILIPPTDNNLDEFKKAEHFERQFVKACKEYGYEAQSIKDLDRDGSHQIDLILGDFMIIISGSPQHIDLKLPQNPQYNFACISKHSVHYFNGFYLMPNKTKDELYIIPSTILRQMLDAWYINPEKVNGEFCLLSKDLFDGRLQPYIDKGWIIHVKNKEVKYDL